MWLMRQKLRRVNNLLSCYVTSWGNFSPNQIEEKLFWLLVSWIWGLRKQNDWMKDKSILRENPCRPTVDGASCGPIGPTLVWPKAILFGQLWYLYKTMAAWPPFRSRSHQSPLWEILPLGSQVSMLFLQKSRFDANMFLINQRFYTRSSPFILN